MVVSPKILIAGLESWRGIARLPQALQRAGFEVGLACRPNSYLAATRFCDRSFHWRFLLRWTVVRRLERIRREWRPDLLVPADDVTAVFLARLCEMPEGLGVSAELQELLCRSLGNPAALAEAASKRLTLEKARQLSLRTPLQQVVRNETEARDSHRVVGFPVVLKQSFSRGGKGVAVCRTAEALTLAWHRLQDAGGLKRRFRDWRRCAVGHALSRKWLQVDGCITANQFIPGTPAMCLVVAVNGTVLAALTAVKERSFPEQTGPSSVVRFVPNAEMRRTAAELTSAWKLTGFIGYDFILDSDGAAWLIECNPRPTPIAHLGALAGEDLCAALFNHLTSRPPVPVAIRSGLVVAHFPQEMARDAASPFLTDGYHDVPEDDPELMHLMLRKSR